MKSLIIALLICFAPFGFLEKDNQKKVLYFGATWCPPCINFKANELPKLKRIQNKIEIYDVDNNVEIYNKWKKNNTLIPLFIFIDENGVEYKRLEGYQSSWTILKIWNST